jgi:DGQHR domain-containing protein
MEIPQPTRAEVQDGKFIQRDALVIVQRGVAMVHTSFTPEQVRDCTKVDVFKPERADDPDNGYQRNASVTRMNQAAAFYGEGSEKRQGRKFEDRGELMPNPIIANIRPDDEGEDDDAAVVGVIEDDLVLPTGVALVFLSDDDRKRVVHALETGGNATAVAAVILHEKTVAWLVDGQHRGGAVKILIDKDRLAADFPVPIVMTIGLHKMQEARQFFWINHEAKNVPTDLTAELLQRMAAQDQGEYQYLSERKNKADLLAGAGIYKALVARKSPWVSRIRQPNEKVSKDTSIAVSQFIASLKPLLTAQIPRELTPEEWAMVIDAFWSAIASVLPTPFSPTELPGEWVLLKATGVGAMHRVLADCLPIIIQRGARLSDPDQYKALLADLPSLTGFKVDPVTGEESQISGDEFWRSASAASGYTGRYGTDRLVGMIRGLIAKTSGSVMV